MTPYQAARAELIQQIEAGGAAMAASQRVPPANLEIEQSLLGTMLANNKVLEGLDDLAPEHFADPAHQRIYAQIREIVDRGQVADTLTLGTWLREDATLEAQGLTVAYVVSLLAANMGPLTVPSYAELVREEWRKREAIRIGSALIGDASVAGLDAPAMSAIDLAADELHRLTMRELGAAAPVAPEAAGRRAMHLMAEAMKRERGVSGVSYGYHALDRMTGGMRPAQLIVLGARPSMGKTAMGLGIAARAAAALPEGDGGQIAFVTKEMPAEALQARVIAAETGLALTAIERGYLEDGGSWRKVQSREFDHAYEAAMRLAALPLVYLDDADRRWSRIAARLRSLHRRRPLRAVVVDYLGLLRGSDAKMKEGSTAETTELSGAMKAFAMELRIPVLCLSQLSRANESREDKRPQLSDLRQSGAIEQDADVVMFLHREHYYLSRTEPQRLAKDNDDAWAAKQSEWARRCAEEEHRGELFIAKQRQGPTGLVRLRWAPETAAYWDESDDQDKRFSAPFPRQH